MDARPPMLFGLPELVAGVGTTMDASFLGVAGVNQRLKEMDVQFIETRSDGQKDFGNVKQGDVVILPAFGASVQVGG